MNVNKIKEKNEEFSRGKTSDLRWMICLEVFKTYPSFFYVPIQTIFKFLHRIVKSVFVKIWLECWILEFKVEMFKRKQLVIFLILVSIKTPIISSIWTIFKILMIVKIDVKFNKTTVMCNVDKTFYSYSIKLLQENPIWTVFSSRLCFWTFSFQR